MSDGLPVPNHADGMMSFKGENGRIILIRNHEIGNFYKLEKLLKLNPIYNYPDFICHISFDKTRRNTVNINVFFRIFDC